MLLMDDPINPSRDAPDAARVKSAIFSAKWANYQGTEPQHYQAHFNELCDIVGHSNPSDDLDNKDFEFQQPAPTPGDRNGVADVFLRGRFVMEYKKPGKNLEDAYNQALRYRDSLGNPPLLIVSDFQTIRIHTNFTGTVSDTYTITLDDLIDIEAQANRRSALGKESKSPLSVYQVLRYCFYEPGNLKPSNTPDDLTQAAADVFWSISDELQTYNPGKDFEIARFLSQLLFCMFASDMGLLKKQLMTEYTQEVGDSPAEVFSERLNLLFDWMNEGNRIASPPIKRFNGGLFDGTKHDLEIVTSIMPLVREADSLGWSQIEPAIFGTLFERIYNPEKRAQHGRHYTSRQDIETLVEPVVMMPLRREWDALKSDLRAADEEEATEKLQGFLNRLGEVRILDPACGSGNFLYVALNLLHELERDVIVWALDHQIDPPLPEIHPRQLLGIEIDEYAHQLASVVVWIGHIQNEARVGNVADRDPILDPIDNIECRDAIVDNSGPEPKPADWPDANFIVGNPPFLGNKRMREEMGDHVVEHLYKVWGENVPNDADLCTYWFENARIQIANGRARRAGLLATQSIRGGSSRQVLNNIKESGDIFFAISDRNWVLEGAAVHISMVGFDDGTETEKIWDGLKTKQIFANLTSGHVDITKAQTLADNQGIAFQGVTPLGEFEISEAQALVWDQYPNPNGRPSSDVLRPFIKAEDIIGRPRNMRIIDFGVGTPEDAAMLYVYPYEYLRDQVQPQRAEMRSASGIRWWLHRRPAPAMRNAVSGLNRFIATPRVSKHRIFKWINAPALPDTGVEVFARDDDYFWGVLHSKPHEVWSLAMGTQLESRPRYTHTTSFETFPLPVPTDQQVSHIGDAAKILDDHRETWLNPAHIPAHKRAHITLTNLYNDYPRWLEKLHEALNRAVFDAYGWTEDPADLDEDTILERLLELNLTREPA